MMGIAQKEELFAEIERLLNRESRSSFQLRLIPDEAKIEDDWVYVPVEANKSGVQALAYAERLTAVESELSDRGVNLVLIPTIATGNESNGE